MSLEKVSTRLSANEALAAGVSMLPPHPGDSPLVPALTNSAHPPIPETSSQTTLSSPPPTPAPTTTPPLSNLRSFGLMAVTTCALAISGAGLMGMTIALPRVQTDLNMTDNDLQWVASAYSLTSACFFLLSGRLADIHGRKLLFNAGMGWLAIWCLIGGFMKNGPGLVVTRALAGIGVAMSTPSAVGLVAGNFSGRRRAIAFAAFSAGAPLGAVVGIVYGGLLTAYTSSTWRAILWLTAGLGLAILVAGQIVIPRDVPHVTDKRLDYIGATLITVGLILLQFVISDAPAASQGWKTPYIIVLLILSVILIGAFFFWEHHVIHRTTLPPLMRLELWTRARGKLAAVYAIGFLNWMCFSALFYHSTLYYQEVQGLDAIGAMLRFLPCPVSGVLCNVVVVYLIRWVPTQWIVCVGLAATGIGSSLFAVAGVTTSYWQYCFNGAWLCVLGADFLMATGSIFVSALALPDEQSVAGALFQTLIQLGGAFGLAFTTLINTSYQTKALAAGKSPVESLLEGLHAAFWLGSGFSFFALAVAAVVLRGMGKLGGSKAEGREKAPREAVSDDGLGSVGNREKV